MHNERETKYNAQKDLLLLETQIELIKNANVTPV